MIEFNQLRDFHSLHMAEEDRYMSWECSKMIKYFDDKEADGSTRQNSLI
jgi:hypothetical protein